MIQQRKEHITFQSARFDKFGRSYIPKPLTFFEKVLVKLRIKKKPIADIPIKMPKHGSTITFRRLKPFSKPVRKMGGAE